MISLDEQKLIEASINILVEDGIDVIEAIRVLINATADYQYTEGADIEGGNNIIQYLKIRLEKELE